MTAREAIDKINNLPIMRLGVTSELHEALLIAVDALEKRVGIVNCIECEHSCFDAFNGMYCNRLSVPFNVCVNSFCSFGDRR